PAFRGSRRLHHGSCDTGPVDAAVGFAGGDDRAAQPSARGLFAVRGFRFARAHAAREPAHAAHDPLFGLARAPLERSGVSGRIPVVHRAALLGEPGVVVARATRSDRRGAVADWKRIAERTEAVSGKEKKRLAVSG